MCCHRVSLVSAAMSKANSPVRDSLSVGVIHKIIADYNDLASYWGAIVGIMA